MASVTIKTAGEVYEIAISSPAVVVGEDERFAATLGRIVDGIVEDYSPALGGQASFVARQLKARLGVTVVSIDEPPPEKGVVY
jgi:hypothetical protein